MTSALSLLPCSEGISHPPNPHIKILSFASQNIESHAFYRLERSLAHLGYDYEVLGRTTVWKNFGTKMRAVYDRLGEIDHPYVAVVDSLDLFFTAPAEEMYHKLTQSPPVVIGGEYGVYYQHGRYPLETIRDFFHNYCDDRARYPNGGFIAGRRENVRELLELNLDYVDDQAAYYDTVFDKRYPLVVDYECRLVGNIPKVSEPILSYYSYDEYINRYRNIHTGEYPVALHFSGGNFQVMHKLYQHLFHEEMVDDKEDEESGVIWIVLAIVVLLILIFIMWVRQ